MAREVMKSAEGGGGHGAGMVPGIKANGFLFLSAIRGSGPDGFPDDTKQQARNAFEGMKTLLAAQGATLNDVVKVTLYLHDLTYRTAFHEVWMEYYPENPPARIALQVADANSQPGRGAHFALDVIAVAP